MYLGVRILSQHCPLFPLTPSRRTLTWNLRFFSAGITDIQHTDSSAIVWSIVCAFWLYWALFFCHCLPVCLTIFLFNLSLAGFCLPFCIVCFTDCFPVFFYSFPFSYLPLPAESTLFASAINSLYIAHGPCSSFVTPCLSLGISAEAEWRCLSPWKILDHILDQLCKVGEWIVHLHVIVPKADTQSKAFPVRREMMTAHLVVSSQ